VKTRSLVFFVFVLVALAGACNRPANSQATPQATAQPTSLVAASSAETPHSPTLSSTPTESIPVPTTIRPTSSLQPAATRLPTATPVPSPTPTLTPVLPSESIVFVRDDTLHQWSPQTNEVKLLAEYVNSRPVYSAGFAAFVRTIVPEQEYALILFHLPTQREVVWATLPYQPYDISISPNGRWAAYIAGGSWDTATIVVQEILINDQQLSLNSPILTVAHSWKWPDRQLNWPTADELSWSNSAGIWLADLNTTPIAPIIAIQPSTNTYPMYPIYQVEGTVEPAIVNTEYQPYRWSPDGRYLLVLEHFSLTEGIDSVFWVIESGTNRSFELPESVWGPLNDEAVWLDETTLLHFRIDNTIRVWHINNAGSDPLMIHDKTIEITNIDTPSWQVRDLLALNNHHVRFSKMGRAGIALYDLNVETGELLKLTSDIDQPYITLHWSPGNQHALWNYSVSESGVYSDRIFLDDLNGDAPTDVTAILGPQSCCWYWLQN
jgi:hypothetical protein